MEQKKKELAKEAARLIKEFNRVQEDICENTLRSVRVSKEGDSIVLSDESKGNLKYGIDFVSSAIGFRIQGFGPCGSDFYSDIEKKRKTLRNNYNKISKKEFIYSIGNLSYIECRCEEIYKRLKEIEREAACLISEYEGDNTVDDF